MKHVFIIETVGPIGPHKVDNLNGAIQDAADRVLDPMNCIRYTCNANSAIRAVYRLFGADEAKSPDELGSAK